MSTAIGACLRRSREVLSDGFTTERIATPCDMTVLEALPASYRRLTASSLHSKAKPRDQLRCPTVPRHSLRLCTMRVSVPSQSPPTHTHPNSMQLTQYECSVSCSSAVRSVGLSNPLHYCHRLFHLYLDTRIFWVGTHL